MAIPDADQAMLDVARPPNPLVGPMITLRPVAVSLTLGLVAGCGTSADGPGATATTDVDPGSVVVVAVRDSAVTTAPLGDVGVASLAVGDEATAICFVARAVTNIGAEGSAVRVQLDGATGYAPVRIIDPETGKSVSFVRQGERWLQGRLRAC
jgi:hypothetical protein